MFSLLRALMVVSVQRDQRFQVKTANLQTLFLGLLLITLLILARNAQCRIGETLEECNARYGRPMEIKKDTALFLKNGMTVSVHLAGGKVDQITYYKTDPKDSKKTISPSDAEVHILLQANAQDSQWKMEVSYRNHAMWWNEERGLSALRSPQELVISIHDSIAYKAYQERKAAVKNLEGF
jgi:hypothetical protein